MNYETCNGITYTIKQGDTLYGISRKYDVPLAMILRANPYADVYRLNIGDTICIPIKRECCDKKNKRDGGSISFNIQNDMSEGVNVPQNKSDIRNDGNISDNENVYEEMMEMSNNMNLPDNIESMPEKITDGENNNMSDDEKWIKYVAQPGDTLWDVFSKSKCDLNEFLNKNGLKGIYILPGLVYFVKEK